MPFDVGVNFSGVKELQKALRAIPVEMRKGAYKKGITKGAQVIARAAKANARKTKDTGTLAKSIGHTVSKSGVSAKIGARSGFRVLAPPHRRTKRYPYIDPRRYAHLVELGTSHSPAQPFLRPAIENNQSAIMAAIAKGVDDGMKLQLAKHARRQAKLK